MLSIFLGFLCHITVRTTTTIVPYLKKCALDSSATTPSSMFSSVLGSSRTMDIVSTYKTAGLLWLGSWSCKIWKWSSYKIGVYFLLTAVSNWHSPHCPCDQAWQPLRFSIFSMFFHKKNMSFLDSYIHFGWYSACHFHLRETHVLPVLSIQGLIWTGMCGCNARHERSETIHCFQSFACKSWILRHAFNISHFRSCLKYCLGAQSTKNFSFKKNMYDLRLALFFLPNICLAFCCKT